MLPLRPVSIVRREVGGGWGMGQEKTGQMENARWLGKKWKRSGMGAGGKTRQMENARGLVRRDMGTEGWDGGVGDQAEEKAVL